MSDGSVSTPAPAQGETAKTAEPAEGSEIQTQQTAVAQDDPEIELDDGVKLKRSELRALHKNRKELDRGAFAKFQEAATLRKEADKIKAEIEATLNSGDVRALIRKSGKDPVKLAEEWLAEALDDFKLSPAERKAREIEAENARLKAEAAEREKKDKDTKEAHEIQHWQNVLGDAFVGAFKTVGLPGDPYLVGQMANTVEALAEAGVPITHELLREIAQDLDDKTAHGTQRVLKSASDEQVQRFLGDDGVEKVRKLTLQKVQGAAQPQARPAAPARKKPSKGLTQAELIERINKRLGA